jgi:lambda family phage portal protein
MPRTAAKRKRPDPLRVLTNAFGGEVMAGGGLEGASRTSRETARWQPSFRSPDQTINVTKLVADARGRDSTQNDGYALNAVSIHRDGIVGSQYRLNAAPRWRAIGADEAWAEEFQLAVEERFTLAAESNDCWLDAQRVNTFTGMVRLAVAGFAMTGEVLASAEWQRDPGRPFKTCSQMISPDRLTNPQELPDNQFLRRGILRDLKGQPLAYSIRQGYMTDPYGTSNFSWNIVSARKPWGRRQIIHIVEQLLPDQSRGVADMVSVLKQMRMTKQFQDVTLQNAVVNASYAAAIESELPGEVITTAMGGGQPLADGNPYIVAIGDYMAALGQYLEGANNIRMDGVMIPHLFPGTKLNMKPVGTPGGVGTDFESSLLRHVAAGLGVSYEELSKDYSKVSYSSARTSVANTGRFMAARKKMVADRYATEIYSLWLEEDWNAGNLPRPRGKGLGFFYEPLMKEALTACTWIGSGMGQIDELKETQAAILRVQAGFSTHEQECAKFGYDYRDIYLQLAREATKEKELGLDFQLSAKRPLGTTTQADPASPPTPAGGKPEETP